MREILFRIWDKEQNRYVNYSECIDGNSDYPFKVLDRRGNYTLFKYLKFKPFTIKEPPPVDWLAEVWDIDDDKFNGVSSESNSITVTWKNIKWLNIEVTE